MDNKTLLWIVIVILAVVTVYILFFQGSVSGEAISSAGQAAKSSSGMVGGC